MQIAICDDEKNIRKLIGDKIKTQFPEAEIDFYSSGDELLLSDKPMDILFLDIQMSGRNGMETATEEYVLINNGGVHIKVKIDDIIYAEVFNRKVVIHKMDETIEYYGKMSDLETLAGDNFFRPHRAYLINFKYVEKYDSTTIFSNIYVFIPLGSIWCDIGIKRYYVCFIYRDIIYVESSDTTGDYVCHRGISLLYDCFYFSQQCLV